LREQNRINKVVIISFDWSWLREFHRLEPDQALGALGPAEVLADGRKPARRRKLLGAQWLDDAAETGARLIVWNRQVSKPAADLARQRGLNVWVYTVNEAALARRLIANGVNGIITNDVRLIRGALSTL
jgi:glycerophosphoryl diester phosphodiesterase